MALQLFIFRHAQSGMDAATDHQRVLTAHGEQQAMFIGEWLKDQDLIPDLVLCSSAQRAINTMELAIKAGEWQTDSHILDALYETNANAVLALIQQLEIDDSKLMLVGHEPTWSELASELCAEAVSFNTAGICLIEFDVDQWQNISVGQGKLQWYQSP